jgi:hypothetical protein
MRVVPRNHGPKIQFFRTHVAKWAQDPLAIGTSAELVAELQAMTDEAAAALAAQHAAQQAARAATLRLRTAIDRMASLGSSVMLQIRGHAGRSASVYALASIPVPAKKSPIAPPGTPHSFKADLWQDGSLALRWKCRNPRGTAGTMYHVYRRIGPSGELRYLGVSGAKRFVDETIPPGSPSVEYQVRAVRGKTVGQWASFCTSFGTMGRRAAMRPTLPGRRAVQVAA